VKKLYILAIIAGCLLVITKICFFSTRQASVSLSQACCEIRGNGLYHWFTDQRIPLVCSKGGHNIGRIEFGFSPEWYPTAIFPTEDKENLICFYETDLTIALFVAELNKDAGSDKSVPRGLFKSSPSIIHYTDFALRRCTNDEVTYLKRYIQCTDDNTFRRLCLTGLPFPHNSATTRKYLLTKIENVTTPGRVSLAGDNPEVEPQ
jgi:hypothetical protein